MYSFLNTLNLLGTGVLLGAALATRRLRPGSSFTPTFRGLFLGLVGSLVVVSVLCMATLELEAFRHSVLQGAAGVMNLAAMGSFAFQVWRKKLSLSFEGLRPNGYTLALGAILITAVFLRVPVSRYVYGGQDQGTYTIMSLMMVRTGKIHQHSPVLQRIETEPELRPLRKAFKHFSRKSGLAVPGRYEGAVYPGFYISNGKKGEITPQFFHLHPAWMAVGTWLWGPKNGVYSLLFLSLLGLMALAVLGRLLFESRRLGRACSLGVTFLGAVHILQVWTSRYPLSEIPYQTFLLCGLATLALALRRVVCTPAAARERERDEPEGDAQKAVLSNPPISPVAPEVLALVGGACLGLTFFVRITAGFIIPVLVLVYLMGPGRKEATSRTHRGFFVAAFAVMAWAGVHAYAHSYPYVYDLVRKRLGVRLLLSNGEVLALALGCLLGGVLLKELAFDRALARPRGWVLGWMSRHRMALGTAAALGVAGALCWQLVWAPTFIQRMGRNYKIARVYQLALFITWPALVGALAGLGYLLGKRPGRAGHLAKMVGIMGLGVAPMVLLWPPYNRYAYYYSRYYVSDLLPLLFLGLTAGTLGAAAILWRKAQRRKDDTSRSRRIFSWAGLALGGAACLGVTGTYIHGHLTNPTYGETELTGAWEAMHKIALQIPKNGLVLMNRRGPQKGSPNFHIMLGTTLRFVYGYETLLLGRLKRIHPKLSKLNRPLFLLEESWSPRARIANRNYMFLLMGGGVLPFNHSQKSLKPPEKYFERWYRYFLYRPRPLDRYTVKPGARRWQERCRGFYTRERRHAWTKGTAHIWGLPAYPGLPVELTIRTRGILPRTLVCPVEIEVNGKPVFKKTLNGRDLDARKSIGPIRVPARINRGALDITIRSCQWRPSELLGKGDRRKLGLDIRSLELKTVRSRGRGDETRLSR